VELSIVITNSMHANNMNTDAPENSLY